MNFFDSLVGPVGKEYCYYFYFLAILSFFLLLAAVLNAFLGIVKTKKFNFWFIVNTILTPLISYFVSRVYYNMCVNSLH